MVSLIIKVEGLENGMVTTSKLLTFAQDNGAELEVKRHTRLLRLR